MNTDKMKELIQSNGGNIFGVTFTKKDGSTRDMTCRLDVKKYTKGGVCASAHIDKYLVVYSLDSKGYRNINLETVKELRMKGRVYDFRGI